MNSRLIHKILVATDGSDLSIEAARYAAEIAKSTSAQVVILNAAEVSGVTQFVSYSVQATEDLGREMRETGEDIIEKTKKPFLEADVPVHSKIIEGYAADVILREAQDGKYDLIAMGSRGLGASFIQQVMLGLGSVAERVIRNASCPVLVVHGRS